MGDQEVRHRSRWTTCSRARLRVEYLLAQGDAKPPIDRCRSALIRLSPADRRRQADLDVTGHLLSCDFCVELSLRLLERRGNRTEQEGDRVQVAGGAIGSHRRWNGVPDPLRKVRPHDPKGHACPLR